VQGKAKRVSDLQRLLEEFYRDKLSELLRHQAGARVVGQYDINNTYQYIINREETQLTWLATAISELGGTPPEDGSEPDRSAGGRGKRQSQAVIEEDSRAAQAFAEKWRPRVDAMTNARHRGMLRVILGETLEQKRFFDQALAGDVDLLGRRTSDVGPRVGSVLPTRWIE
jgi:hypothetical protein